jgi:hypothetical protein
MVYYRCDVTYFQKIGYRPGNVGENRSQIFISSGTNGRLFLFVPDKLTEK